MRDYFRKMGTDLRHLTDIDAYAAALIAFLFAVLSLAGDILPDSARWAALLAGVGVLVFRITLPERRAGSADDVLKDRSDFADKDKAFATRVQGAKELWVFAPSAANLLTPENCGLLRTTILANPQGVVRVAVLNPASQNMVNLAGRQLDDSLDYPPQLFGAALNSSIAQFERLRTWQLPGSFEYRLADYNPGFSLVAVDPTLKHGVVIVEFHGYHNQGTNARMHIELSRDDSDNWFPYWLDQFNRIWQDAVPATAPA